MGIKTSQSYQKEVLEKYKSEKGREMSFYLAQPTPSQIREACLVLLEKRKSKNDQKILNRFFQFRNEEDRIKEIQNFDGDKFKPIVNFLKGGVKKTHVKNIELISWLIDFQPRPLQEYLKSDSSISEEEPEKLEIFDEPNDEKEKKKQEEKKRRFEKLNRKEEEKEKRTKRWRNIIISIGVAFGITMLILGVQRWSSYFPKNNSGDFGCMTWADSLYVVVSCDKSPLSKYGTQVKPLDKRELKNMRRVEVTAAYDFFTVTGKPRIWYYKNDEDLYEYFTAPGLHPINGETLKKITPYIIHKYVPVHTNKKSSFAQ
ncbi:hypothetical protein EJ994_13615 [Maribacter sp. MJ134]|uniref:hypothetical protein n=1 Tax=Maribacter sp. MJ134 TaxID=2496865 RepID=UPI000F822108|nr:hypothetical protein [Maribacter sp. MJ134]AZQ59783.1 hypothetical protein EJ994_13615 [Maribacter sp. MJ134]